MPSNDEVYRLVPYRFFIKDSDADTCKLEKLTNLFPDMKTIIELELFKFNNLTRIVDRLSQVYSVSTAVDKRDDTVHVFLGPYHLVLGSAAVGAMHFKNISTALLSATSTKMPNDPNTTQYQKRRRDAVLRRFRRGVRKLILIKSIIDNLRHASILTPYNQCELYNRGIYDLVLAGHKHDGPNIFNDQNFKGQLDDFQSMNDSEKETSLIASKYMKISALLHLISPTPHLHQTDNSSSVGTNKQNTSSSFNPNNDHSSALFHTTAMCCPHHCKDLPLIKFPIRPSFSHQASLLVTPEPHSRLSTSSNNSSRKSETLKRQTTINSLPDFSNDTKIKDDIPSSTKAPFDLTTEKLDHPINIPIIHTHSPVSQPIINQENVFINSISSILTNYLSSHTNNNLDIVTDDKSSPLSIIPKITLNKSDQSSTVNETNEFNKLLLELKTIVDNKLCIETSTKNQISSSGIVDNKNSIEKHPHHRRKKVISCRTASSQETSNDNFNKEYLVPLPKKDKLNTPIRSRSFDENHLRMPSIESETNNNELIL
ncbi:unnamed protein product [Adineta steineri]|uniref:Uncharacterized protein n=2 Tax=Adineta steineri TaxID=433720 RepID=A0A814YIS7_9BILA|nr:unnamed protein product [Adineta steineri]CAF3570062.1 unnamed protein product [Adineta steineri]